MLRCARVLGLFLWYNADIVSYIVSINLDLTITILRYMPRDVWNNEMKRGGLIIDL